MLTLREPSRRRLAVRSGAWAIELLQRQVLVLPRPCWIGFAFLPGCFFLAVSGCVGIMGNQCIHHS